MELFVSLVNNFQLLTNVLNNSILDVLGFQNVFDFINLQSPWQVFQCLK